MPRKYTMVHDSMLIRWLMKTYPFGTWKLNARLGKVKKKVLGSVPKQYRGLTSRWKLIADAVVISDGKVAIIECLVRPNEWWKIQQLKSYEKAFKVTEEYRRYWNYPIEKILLTTQIDPFMESEAIKEGIRVVKYTTPDIEHYKGTLRKRQIAPQGGALEILP